MTSKPPAYYSRLAPFRKLFNEGHPILTYHKLGPRPSRDRLKGLYLGQPLFSRQLEELRKAGFKTGTLDACAGPKTEQTIVVTFDDGYVNVLRYGLNPLAATQFKAIQFLVADLLGGHNEWDVALGEAPEPMMNMAQVREWLAAGHDVGSHTLTHPYLTRLPVGRAREEIRASRKKLEDLFGRPIRHFCYPYGDWNKAVRDLVEEAGYATACTTEFGVNAERVDSFALQRVAARYQSRSWKALRGWLNRRFGVLGG